MVYTAGMLKTATRSRHSSAKGVSWIWFGVNCLASLNKHITNIGNLMAIFLLFPSKLKKEEKEGRVWLCLNRSIAMGGCQPQYS